jgi:hypothetical protein
MPPVTAALTAIIFVAGAAAGTLGALLGLGGGIFLVPLLNLGLGFPIGVAAAISLATVIATSSTVTAGKAGQQLINFRFGMVLEVATAAGSVLGGITAQFVSQAVLQRLFAAVTASVAVATIARSNRRNVIADSTVDPGVLGGRLFDHEQKRDVVYRIRNLPLALVVSFLAGNVSSLLGIGGGVVKVPVLNAWCGMPLRAAAATSAFMIGVTAASSAFVYFGRGDIDLHLSAAVALGTLPGSLAGARLSEKMQARSLKLLMAGVLVVVASRMLWEAR